MTTTGELMDFLFIEWGHGITHHLYGWTRERRKPRTLPPFDWFCSQNGRAWHWWTHTFAFLLPQRPDGYGQSSGKPFSSFIDAFQGGYSSEKWLSSNSQDRQHSSSSFHSWEKDKFNREIEKLEDIITECIVDNVPWVQSNGTLHTTYKSVVYISLIY